MNKGVHTAPGGLPSTLPQLLNKIAPLTAMSIAPGGPPPYIRLAQSAALASALEFREWFVFVAEFSISLSYRTGT